MAEAGEQTSLRIISAPSRFKSQMWKHFGFYTLPGRALLDMNKMVCKLCHTVIAYCGNTTNLSAHLARHHPKLNAKQPAASQQTLDVTLSKLPCTSEKAKRITESIALFICKDIQPYSVVENAGFRNMIHTLEPRYVIPSRKLFTDTVVPKIYDEVASEVKKPLSKAQRVAFSCDAWTSRATESYVTLTAHHITDDWYLSSHALQTRAFYESHTGANLAELLRGVATEWNLTNKDPALVTDNASNMVIAAQLTGFLHIKCYAHTLNLALQRALKLPAFAKLLGRV
ncbi:zinc finger BED domain-containing protein 1-like isoform X1 [Tachysurus ichikawai]